MLTIAPDTETTGLGLHHGCLPFMVQAASYDSSAPSQFPLHCWEWEVDPLTRLPLIPRNDKLEVRDFLLSADEIILHNAKFDVRALDRAGIIKPDAFFWSKIRCTQVLSHLRKNTQLHGLKPLGIKYLNINSDDEDDLKEIVRQCLSVIRKYLPAWRIAKVGDPHFPTQKSEQEDGMWKNDCWVPAALHKHIKETCTDYGLSARTLGLLSTVCSTYGLRDVERTMGLWLKLRPTPSRPKPVIRKR